MEAADPGRRGLTSTPVRRMVRAARPATAAEWQHAWRSCPYATCFQSPTWAEDWSRYSGGWLRPAPLLVTLSDGMRVVIPLTRQRRHRGLANRRVLSPAGTYGGWLAAEGLPKTQAEALLSWILRARASLWWRVNPFDPCAAVLEAVADEPDATHVLRLSSGPEAAFARASRGHRSALRKARRSGLTVRRADSADDWARYYSVYESSLARWGAGATSCYGAGLFEILRRRGRPDIDLWLVELDDALVVAGGLCVYGPRHAAYWHGAALAEFFEFRPANLLMHELVADACARGLEWFDLNPSGGHEGVDIFKRRVGAERLACPIIKRERARDLFLDRLLKAREEAPVADA